MTVVAMSMIELVCGAKLWPPTTASSPVAPARSEGSDRSPPRPPDLPTRPRLRDLRQIVRHDAPADPPARPPLAVVAASLQPIIALQRMDSSLDPGAEPITSLEPPPPLLPRPPRRRPAHVRQRHLLDPRLLRQPLVGRRRQPAVRREQVRRPAELPMMVGQRVSQVRLVLPAGLLDDRV